MSLFKRRLIACTTHSCLAAKHIVRLLSMCWWRKAMRLQFATLTIAVLTEGVCATFLYSMSTKMPCSTLSIDWSALLMALYPLYIWSGLLFLREIFVNKLCSVEMLIVYWSHVWLCFVNLQWNDHTVKTAIIQQVRWNESRVRQFDSIGHTSECYINLWIIPRSAYKFLTKK